MPVESEKYAATIAQSIAVSFMRWLRARERGDSIGGGRAVYLVASSAQIGEGMHRYTRKSAFATLAVAIACVGSAGKPHARQGAGHARPGITVLLADSSALIDGKRVGLLTNQNGVDEHGVSDIDLIVKRGAVKGGAGPQLTALFSPEHGIRGTEDRTNLA